MGGSYSKNSFFDKPKEYRNVEIEDDFHHDREWTVLWFYLRSSDEWFFKIQLRFPEKTQVEFIYQFVFAHKCQKWRKGLVIRGVGKLDERHSAHKVYHKCFGNRPTYMSFQAIVHVILEGKIRMINFYDDIFGISKIFDIDGQKLAVPMIPVIQRAPLLAIDIEKDKLSQKLKMHLIEFLQILHGVQIQLTEKNLKEILELATKYKVINVKKYCEHQLIWRDDFEFSKKKKFKMACKFSLNILMNQLLRDVKTLKELAKFAMYTSEIKAMDSNTSKLLIAKMFEIS